MTPSSCAANVASKVQVQDAADRCVTELGGIDIAVANAGIARGGSVLDLDLKDWQDQLDINLTGVFLTVQAAAQRMVKQGRGGRIICISSLAALMAGAFDRGAIRRQKPASRSWCAAGRRSSARTGSR